MEFDDGRLGPAIGDVLDGVDENFFLAWWSRFGHDAQRFRHAQLLTAQFHPWLWLFSTMSDLMASRQGSSRLRVDGVSEDYAAATADDDVDQLHLDLQRAVDGRPSFPAGRQSRSVQYLLQLATLGDHPRHGDAIHPVRPQFQVLIEFHLHRVLQVVILLFQRLP